MASLNKISLVRVGKEVVDLEFLEFFEDLEVGLEISEIKEDVLSRNFWNGILKFEPTIKINLS